MTSKRHGKAGKGDGTAPPPEYQALQKGIDEALQQGIEEGWGRLSIATWFYVSRAREGDSWCLQQLLQLAAFFLREGRPMPPPVATFLADRLDEISKSPEPWKKPFLPRRRGMKEGDSAMAFRNGWIAYQYWAKTKVHKEKGTGVIRELADKTGLGEEAVKSAVRAGMVQIKALPDELLGDLKKAEKGEK